MGDVFCPQGFKGRVEPSRVQGSGFEFRVKVKVKVDSGSRVSADTMACHPSTAEQADPVLLPVGVEGLILAGRSVQRPAPPLMPEEGMRPLDSREDARGISTPPLRGLTAVERARAEGEGDREVAALEAAVVDEVGAVEREPPGENQLTGVLFGRAALSLGWAVEPRMALGLAKPWAGEPSSVGVLTGLTAGELRAGLASGPLAPSPFNSSV